MLRPWPYQRRSGLQLIEETGLVLMYFKNIEVFPNPTSDKVRITYDKLFSASLELRLIDMSGHQLFRKEIAQGSFREEVIDVSDYDTGVYMLNIVDTRQSNQSVQSYRLIVER